MATSFPSPVYARFNGLQVDLASGVVRKSSGAPARLQQKPLQVLRLLLGAEGRIVTREQLRAALWPENTFVDFEHSVNTAVSKLRQALEDSGENPRLIETLPKVGYRFMVPVTWEPARIRVVPPQARVVPLPTPCAKLVEE